MEVLDLPQTVDTGAMYALLGAYHGDPFAVLGMHQVGNHLAVRVIRPDARALSVVRLKDGKKFPAKRLHQAGFFEAILPAAEEERFDYELEATAHDGHLWRLRDPYSFGQILGPMDLHLFSEGNHYEIYKKLGAHTMTMEGVRGCSFAVWAPNAQRVSVIGDFNHWDGRYHPMRKLVGSGVWEVFLPEVAEGAHYKFEIKASHGGLLLKSDPYAFYGQHGRQTASMVFDLNRYTWADAEWMEARAKSEWLRKPVAIYEVHPGSWARHIAEGNRYLSYIELADALINYVVDMGYTHIELMGIAEHPFDGSWGYQVTGYYAPTSRYGNPDEFRHFVDRCHQRGIGVLMDWVPGHFPKDAHGLAEFDGTDLYEHQDPRKGEHMDWGTLIFNYGRNEVRNFLIGNALFWLDEYHVDGLRVDAVASMLYLDYSRKPGQWVPNEYGGRENLEAIYFLKRCNEVCYERFPGIMTVAEESTSWPGVSRPTYLGGLGFGFKWNMGWMHDFLDYMSLDPVFRRFHQGAITFSLVYAFHEHFMLVLSHDEVVHGKGSLIGKMPGDWWQKFANLRLFYAWMYAHPGKKLLFMGGEFGQSREWNHDRGLDWWLLDFPEHAGLRRLVQHVNWLYKSEPALWELDDTYEGYEWIDFHDADNCVVAFMRKARTGAPLVFVVNATPVIRENYRLGVPGEGFYQEILNTDAEAYGGSNVGNFGGVHAEPIPWQNQSHSIVLRLPPLAVSGFKRVR
jgi:1,4-alpha-glucan branching enzyme